MTPGHHDINNTVTNVIWKFGNARELGKGKVSTLVVIHVVCGNINSSGPVKVLKMSTTGLIHCQLWMGGVST